MLWIGLTGGIGSGKSTVSMLLKRSACPVVDADEIAQQVVGKGSEGLRKLVKEFGPDILTDDGSLDRKKMGALVFSDSEKLLQLEKIVHPLVQKEVLRQRQVLEQAGHKFAFYDVPLLFEKNLQSQFDLTILVSAKESQQLERLQSGRGMSLREAKQRIAAQLGIDHKIKLADYVIDNSGDLKNLEDQVNRLLAEIKKQSPKPRKD